MPQEIYRENVEPAKGGKVPESAHLRAELNMIDTAGLRDPEGIEMEQMMAAMSPELPDHMLADHMSQYHPGLIPTLKLHSKYNPEMAHMGPMAHMAQMAHPSPAPVAPYSPAPVAPVAPVAPYSPAPVAPVAPYSPAPVAPVVAAVEVNGATNGEVNGEAKGGVNGEEEEPKPKGMNMSLLGRLF